MPLNLKGYDLSDIRAICKNDDGMLNRILTVLISTLTTGIENIKTAADENKWEEVSQIAHRMKTSIIHIRADSIRLIINDLEHNYNEYSVEYRLLLVTELCILLANILHYLKIDLIDLPGSEINS